MLNHENSTQPEWKSTEELLVEQKELIAEVERIAALMAATPRGSIVRKEMSASFNSVRDRYVHVSKKIAQHTLGTIYRKAHEREEELTRNVMQENERLRQELEQLRTATNKPSVTVKRRVLKTNTGEI